MGERVLRALVPPASLVVLVLGSILLGLATPTEAASLGCVGAILLAGRAVGEGTGQARSEEHTSELQSLMRSSYAVFCLKKKKRHKPIIHHPSSPQPNTTYNREHTS